VRFLQIAVQVMTRDPATLELLKNNDPVVRNDLLLLFGNQKYAQLATREGKEALRNQALDDLRKVITQAGGHAERLEAVYFTSFVMQ
jgi:flagellar FliL protein